MSTEAREGAGDPPVAALVRAAMGGLSAGERKVARALLAAYPVAGLGTAAELGEQAGVSAPTVVRFVAHLGFPGYAAFQRALRHEVHVRMGSPLEQYAEQREVPPGEELLPFVSSTFARTLQASFAELPASEFERAVDLLADPRLHVHVVGGRFSHVLADYLVAHLQMLRAHVGTVPGDEFSRITLVTDARREDLLVVFDYRRYDPASVRLCSAAAAAGARVLLLTDPWLSPAAEVADVVLPTHVESPSPFDSLVPGMALVEALVTALTERLGDAGRARVERVEQVRTALDPHATSPLPGHDATAGTTADASAAVVQDRHGDL